MEPFNIKTFVEEPTLKVVKALKKAELIQVAQHYKLEASSALKKSELKRLVIEYLVEEEVVSEDDSELPPTASPGDTMSSLELRRLELQDKERERESQLKLKELEIREKELSVQLRLRELDSPPVVAPLRPTTTSQFDISKHIRFVPPFQEKEVDKYFLHYEKIATSLDWPRETWTLLLQSVLTGKAREVYSALSVEQSSQYDAVKTAILKAYELVPEAYRQQFRNSRKEDSQTFTEFAREKEVQFDRWCASKEVNLDFNKLRQLILLEEFKSCLPPHIKTYLDERNAESLHQAAVLAEDYSLTHKGTFSRGIQDSSAGLKNTHNEGTHNPASTRSSGSTRQPEGQKPSRSNVPVCFYCKKKGHVMAECWKREKKRVQPNFLAVPQHRQPTGSGTVPVSPESQFNPFVSKGLISLSENGEQIPITILRDTGATQTLIVEGTLPLTKETATGTTMFIQGVGLTPVSVPLHTVYLRCGLVSGPVVVGARPTLPVQGISLLLGNDLAGSRVIPDLSVTNEPELMKDVDELDSSIPGLFPACAVTRAAAMRAASQSSDDVQSDNSGPIHQAASAVALEKTDDGEDVVSVEATKFSREQLIKAQEDDVELRPLMNDAVGENEVHKYANCFYRQSGVLMRKWRPPDVPANEDWQISHQIVLPQKLQEEVLALAHASPMAGHLGVNKTYHKILTHFYWPKLKRDVAQFCRTCHICQVVGKPNQTIPVAPLKPIPACGEPFNDILIDCVGPLPKTKSGNKFLFTIMCKSTRFPEAIPLRNIKAPKIVDALVKFFTFVGLPKSVQSDQGSNFMSGVMQQVVCQLGIKQYKSSAYHPESQGALERFHQTLKNMIRAYCTQYQSDWDQGIHLLLFAAREAVQESLGFSPFELVFGRTVRGPLKLLKESWLADDPPDSLLDQVSSLRNRLMSATELAQQNLKNSQGKMKTWYDKKARDRSFRVGERVLVLLPIPQHPLQARYCGPYVVTKKIGELDYVIATPDRRKAKRLCHVNMLKKYHGKETDSVVAAACVIQHVSEVEQEEVLSEDDGRVVFRNSDVLCNMKEKLSHLCAPEGEEMAALITEFSDLFSDVPGRTSCVHHHVDVGNATPIKQNPYRVNPRKLEFLKKELDYMLTNDIIEPSQSNWSSPCLLVPKSDGTYRFCTDYRKVNTVTKSDSYPIPRVEDCIDRIGCAQYVSKIDLLKGYWQVPLTATAKEISAFVTPEGFYQYKVMPFGMKNSPATFQRLINRITENFEGCEAYIDDIVVFGSTWEQHLQRVRELFHRLRAANLTVNLVKSEFGHAHVTYLGHVVGQGQVKPVDAKVEAIIKYPTPTTRKELMRFLGMAGYYRKFCRNFASVCEPLTNLLKKSHVFEWSVNCKKAFETIKSLLVSAPVLATPDFDKPFILTVDASDVGAGAVLLQEDGNGVDHPIGYFSLKFNPAQRIYSTSEKEALALVYALQHFDFYINPAQYPIRVYTDHNPLVFLNKVRTKNQRLWRWSLALQAYDLDIRHIAGKDNVLADALSRDLSA